SNNDNQPQVVRLLILENSARNCKLRALLRCLRDLSMWVNTVFPRRLRHYLVDQPPKGSSVDAVNGIQTGRAKITPGRFFQTQMTTQILSMPENSPKWRDRLGPDVQFRAAGRVNIQ